MSTALPDRGYNPRMDTVLSISGANKRFGDIEALRGADLSLAAGEWLALLGPNGAGKTTLVRAVCGRVALDSGGIRMFGREVSGKAPDRETRARIGLVPQEIALYPLLTAAENLRAFGAFAGVPRAALAERVDWALQWTGLADRASEPVKRYSGGMKRRLNVACGVLHRPEVLLLDEPTVGVDPQSRERIWEMLSELHQEGTSLLLTTHQLDEAQSVAERIAIIDHGRDIATGTFEELLTKTIGRHRRITAKFADGRTVERTTEDIGRELRDLLESEEGDLDDVRVDAPNLQAVFLHLTGRQLRE